MNSHCPELPIDRHLDQLRATLRAHNCLIVEAPPGTGKTTRAAPAIVSLVPDDSRAKRVLLIQPRRIAARAAAARIAAEQNCDVGDLVGYQVRFDSRVSSKTRLIAMTPGILLRQLQSNAVLEDVAAVVLDEFHERSLELDLLLGMLRRIQTELRPDLRLVVMSATLDSQAVEQYLVQAPILKVVAQTYPVRVEYNPVHAIAAGGRTKMNPVRRIIDQAIDGTRRAAAAHEGDILVFLPGVGEIFQVEAALERDAAKENWKLLKLYGDMLPQDQDRVLAPCSDRKVILATNVAETSLTIDGVRVVVDSGWARVQRFDPSIGLNMLVLQPISRASADQRAGRAGRTAPGICYRLWDEITGRSRPEHLEPEIQRVDLAGAILELLCWGETEILKFPWITPPTKASVSQALETLRLLGAVDAGKVTALGRTMNRLPVQPRLARMMIAGHQLQIPMAATLAAASLSERDIFDRSLRSQPQRFSDVESHSSECDVTRQVIALQNFITHGQVECELGTIKIAAARNCLRVAEQLHRQLMELLGASSDVAMHTKLQQAMLVAFPDRVAKRRSASNPRGLMVGGRGVQLDGSSCVQKSELFLCLDVDAAGIEAHVRKASAIEADWLNESLLVQRDERFFNPTQLAVVTRRRTYFIDLLLAETPIETRPDEETAQQLAAAAATRFDRLLPPKDKALHSWLARVKWLAREMPDAPLPKFDVASLTDIISGWCFGMRSLEELKQLPWKNLLESLLTSEGRRLLDSQAPESVTLPTGRTVLLHYELAKPPVLAARIQDFFGWTETPRLAGGRIPLVLHLLAPNGRVQQITEDLASFWANTYFVVRKELRGRYPKNDWPENPLLFTKGK